MARKLTSKEFIEKSIKIHGNKYDYSLVDYINNNTKVKIICKKHGIFEMLPRCHISNFGCKKCSRNILSTEEFIKKAIEIHKNKYNYDHVDYKDNSKKIKIFCKKHGIFLQKANEHLRGSGCPMCGGHIRYTTESFIKYCKEKHGEDIYDYSLTNYTNSLDYINIICKKHGLFKQIASSHMSGSGCAKCAKERNKINLEEFLYRSKCKHGNKYDYSLVKYIDNNAKVDIICTEHGIFKQTPRNHTKYGCKKCALDSLSSMYSDTQENFIKKCKDKHNNKYDYSKVIYKNYNTKIIIICPEHGEFEQYASSHYYNGCGCKKCSSSIGNTKIGLFLSKNKINYIPEKYLNGCIYKNHLYFDFYLPEHNICIEYDGKQHFESVEYFGGKEEFENIKIRDKIKNEYCEKNKIKLIRIKYNEDILKRLNKELKHIFIDSLENI